MSELFNDVRADAREAAAKLAADHGLRMVVTPFANRTTITLVGPRDEPGAPRHPVRIEMEIWKPLNEDHSVAEGL